MHFPSSELLNNSTPAPEHCYILCKSLLYCDVKSKYVDTIWYWVQLIRDRDEDRDAATEWHQRQCQEAHIPGRVQVEGQTFVNEVLTSVWSCWRWVLESWPRVVFLPTVFSRLQGVGEVCSLLSHGKPSYQVNDRHMPSKENILHQSAFRAAKVYDYCLSIMLQKCQDAVRISEVLITPLIPFSLLTVVMLADGCCGNCSFFVSETQSSGWRC